MKSTEVLLHHSLGREEVKAVPLAANRGLKKLAHVRFEIK